MEMIRRTPYLSLDSLQRPDIVVKLECEQFGGSFKARGVVQVLKQTKQVEGLVTFTTGNQGIAVAAIAQHWGVPALVVSTHRLTAYKRARIEAYGGQVICTGTESVEDATAFAMQLASKRGFEFIPLSGDERLLVGYSEVAQEILEDVPGRLTLFLPVDSGSLLLANSRLLKQANKAHRVVGVEPTNFQRLGNPNGRAAGGWSIADSLAIDRIPEHNRPLMNLIDGVVTVEEAEITAAMRLLQSRFGILAEPGGVVSLAAALKTTAEDTVKVAVITGKNISQPHFLSLLGAEQKITATAAT